MEKLPTKSTKQETSIGKLTSEARRIGNLINHVLLEKNIFEDIESFTSFLSCSLGDEEKKQIILLNTIENTVHSNILFSESSFFGAFINSSLSYEIKKEILQILFHFDSGLQNMLIGKEKILKTFLESNLDEAQKQELLESIFLGNRSVCERFVTDEKLLSIFLNSGMNDEYKFDLFLNIFINHSDSENPIYINSKSIETILNSSLNEEHKSDIIILILEGKSAHCDDFIIDETLFDIFINSQLSRSKKNSIIYVLINGAFIGFEKLFERLNLTSDNITDENKYFLLTFYSSIFTRQEGEINADIENSIIELTQSNADFLYNSIFQEYLSYLQGFDTTEIYEILDIININGAGDLTQLESLCSFFSSLITKGADNENYFSLLNNLLSIHEYDNKKGIDRTKNTQLFDLGIDFLEIDIDIARFYFSYINNFPENLRNYFFENLFSIHHIYLMILQEMDEEGNYYYNDGVIPYFVDIHINDFSYKLRDIIENQLQLGENEKEIKIKELIHNAYQKTFNEIQKLIQEKFGIIKIPEITQENNAQISETIKLLSTFYGNISDRNELTTHFIGLILGLKLNNLYEDFKKGKEINYFEIFEKQKALEHSNFFNPKDSEEDIMRLYLPLLNSEEISTLMDGITISNIGHKETIIEKLLHILSETQTLLDSDNYEDNEKWIIAFLQENKGKNIPKALAAKYHNIVQQKELSEEDKEIIISLEKYIGTIDTKEKLLPLQELTKTYYQIFQFIQKIQGFSIQEKVQALHTNIIPNQDLKNIFHKLGEKDVGVQLHMVDIERIKDIFEKNKNKLSQDERTIFLDFLENIENQLKEFTNFIEDIKVFLQTNKIVLENKKLHKNYEKLKIAARLDSIINAVYNKGEKDDFNFLTQITSDIEVVLKNIRGCLSIHRKEANNDTNVRFLTPNEFFITSYKAGTKKSFADQVVTLLDNTHDTYFILDTIRGENKSPDISLAHIKALIELIKKLGRKDIKIFFPENASHGNGITKEYILSGLCESNMNVKITESDGIPIYIMEHEIYDVHYEWHNEDPRTKGDIETYKGLIIEVI